MSKKQLGKSPTKGAALPRPNKAGKRPPSNRGRRLRQQRAAIRSTRPYRQSIGRPIGQEVGYSGPFRLLRSLREVDDNPRKQAPRSYKLSDTLSAARNRNKPSAKKSVKNPKSK